MFHRSALPLLCLLAFSAVGMGCSKETTSSSNIKTGGIAALIDVNAFDDTTATVHVELKVGGSSSNTYVDLEGNDELVATAAGATKTLKVVDTGIYEADFSGVEGGTEFTVSLERPDDATASDNSGNLPDPFTLDDPPTGLSRMDDDLTLTWAPADTGDGMHAAITGKCIFPYDKDMSDTGGLVVAAGKIDSTGGDMPETCDLTAKLERVTDGVADTQFDPESYFRLHQFRSGKFTSKP
jgi:hypothetical protein